MFGVLLIKKPIESFTKRLEFLKVVVVVPNQSLLAECPDADRFPVYPLEDWAGGAVASPALDAGGKLDRF